MTKERIDVLMTNRGLTESRSKAQRLVRAGEVRVNGQLVHKPSTKVPTDAEIALQAKLPFVGRGGEKLDAALNRFGIDVNGAVAADVGASTGGFTDCLLQHGAQRVYAIDSGYGQLHWRLRNDPRVVVMERTNARHLESLPEPVDVATIDVSFISLALILPRVVGWLQRNGDLIALIKPQFEAGRQHVQRGGVVRDPATHRRVLERTLDSASKLDLRLRGLMPSPLRGPAGNIEFLAWWRRQGQKINQEGAVERALSRVPPP